MVKKATDTPVKAKATKKTTKTPVQEAAPAPTPAPVEETNAVVEESAEKSIADDFSVFMSHLQALTSSLSNLKNEFRVLEKKAVRELKAAKKASSKRARKSGNRSPSGFVKPTLVTDELATFLGKPSGTEMARTEVTREINKYIRAHNLQDKTNGRRIIPDAALAKLLKLKKEDELTYFNLQRYMSPHFPKPAASASA
jgi:chromatin remodeling complex protein RSC6